MEYILFDLFVHLSAGLFIEAPARSALPAIFVQVFFLAAGQISRLPHPGVSYGDLPRRVNPLNINWLQVFLSNRE
ncbi:MAG TPA: hypothetical protein PLD51_02935 [Pontiellaceae bacterium]|nr:hypothetical protein [Pontiellaceae bacterium]